MKRFLTKKHLINKNFSTGGSLEYYVELKGNFIVLEERAIYGPAKSLTNCMEEVLRDLRGSLRLIKNQRVFQIDEDGVFEILYKTSPLRPNPPIYTVLEWKWVSKNKETFEVLYG